ncbi:MAG: YraN family protein [Polyangiales bacterium]
MTNAADSKQEIGRQGETYVAALLRERGFLIVARNARAGRYEIDIIATRGRLLVFCEVRTRQHADFGAPAESVGPKKQESLRLGARRWLEEHPGYGQHDVRFDVAGVTLKPQHIVDYYVDAF